VVGNDRVRELEGLLAERDRRIAELEGRIAELEQLIEELRRAGKRQAAPFSKGEPKQDPKPPGRKPGRGYGRQAVRPIPAEVDESFRTPCPRGCPCGGRVRPLGELKLYEVDLLPVKRRVREFVNGFGECLRCGRHLTARHPLQTSKAQGAVGRVHIGPVAIGLAAHLKVVGGMSYEKIQVLMDQVLGFRLARSSLCRAIARLAQRAEPTYRGLIEQIRASPVVYPDETGWKLAGRKAWLWAFTNLKLTVYSILQGRGYAQAASILGQGYSGILAPDGWAPYQRFQRATLQTCNAHLLRRCREILETATRGAVRFPRAVKQILQHGLALRDRRDARHISAHGLKVAHGRLKARLDRLLAGQHSNAVNRRFANHLRRHRHELFVFLQRREVEATNWPAEQALRPAVVNRKTCAGNRSERGARTLSILMSVLRTAQQQRRRVLDVVADILRDPVPRPHLSPVR
jgi:transposase